MILTTPKMYIIEKVWKAKRTRWDIFPLQTLWMNDLLTYWICWLFSALNSSICNFIGDKFFAHKNFAFYLHEATKAQMHIWYPKLSYCNRNGQEIIFDPKKKVSGGLLWCLFACLFLILVIIPYISVSEMVYIGPYNGPYNMII